MKFVRVLRARLCRVLAKDYPYTPWLAFLGVLRIRRDYVERMSAYYAGNVPSGMANGYQPLDHRHADAGYWRGELDAAMKRHVATTTWPWTCRHTIDAAGKSCARCGRDWRSLAPKRRPA